MSAQMVAKRAVEDADPRDEIDALRVEVITNLRNAAMFVEWLSKDYGIAKRDLDSARRAIADANWASYRLGDALAREQQS